MRRDGKSRFRKESNENTGKRGLAGLLARLSGKTKRTIAIVLAVILLFGLTYGRNIIRLKTENRELKQQQEELQAEKNAKTKELKNAHSRDYIEEQARKQLRLLNKDEILFIFDDDKDGSNGKN